MLKGKRLVLIKKIVMCVIMSYKENYHIFLALIENYTLYMIHVDIWDPLAVNVYMVIHIS